MEHRYGKNNYIFGISKVQSTTVPKMKFIAWKGTKYEISFQRYQVYQNWSILWEMANKRKISAHLKRMYFYISTATYLSFFFSSGESSNAFVHTRHAYHITWSGKILKFEEIVLNFKSNFPEIGNFILAFVIVKSFCSLCPKPKLCPISFSFAFINLDSNNLIRKYWKLS